MPISLSLIYCFKFCSNISTSLLTYIFTILSSFFSSSYPFYQYLLLFRLLPSSSIISFLILIIIPLIALLFLFILFVSCTFHISLRIFLLFSFIPFHQSMSSSISSCRIFSVLTRNPYSCFLALPCSRKPHFIPFFFLAFYSFISLPFLYSPTPFFLFIFFPFS